MKKMLLTLFACMASFGYAIAQDVITTREGKDIQAKIVEVTSDEIKYKKFNNPDGPLFTLKKSEVLIVRYQNGENEVFANEPQQGKQKNNTWNGTEVHQNMKYSQYKRLYDPSTYFPEYGDPYRPGLCGVASFFIPGLGQGCAGEWGRGIAFFLGSSAAFGLGILSYVIIDGELRNWGESWGLYAGMGASLIVDIWSIVDAVKVAKIKNMYVQDVRKQRADIDVNLMPSLSFAPTDGIGTMTPVTGLSLSLRF